MTVELAEKSETRDRGNRCTLPASIEVSPRQAQESADLPNLFPTGTHVYITDLGTDPDDVLVKAAKRVSDLGYEPVSHIAARRLTTKAALENRVKALAQDAGVKDVLVIGGGLDRPAGDFTSTLDVLQTGILDQNGIKRIGIAGHPEGSPDFSDEVATQALLRKADYARQTDAQMRIVTQFGFDADAFISWAIKLRQDGIMLPVHIGVSGPAKLTTLIKYAAMCGVGNSIGFLKKRAGSLANLVVRHSPDEIASPLEKHALGSNDTGICQFHVFPFGGLKASAAWLRERNSWPAEG